MPRRLFNLYATLAEGLIRLMAANNILAQRTAPERKDDSSLASGFAINALEQSRITPFRDTRQEKLATAAVDQLKFWHPICLREPIFNNPESNMPNTSVTPGHATTITDYLINTTSAAQTDSIMHGPLLLIWWRHSL